MENIQAPGYWVTYSPERETVEFSGSLRLQSGKDSEEIFRLLSQVIELAPVLLTLDLVRLSFANSLAIGIFTKFVVKMRNQEKTELAVRIQNEVTWQRELASNLKRFKPSIKIEAV